MSSLSSLSWINDYQHNTSDPFFWVLAVTLPISCIYHISRLEFIPHTPETKPEEEQPLLPTTNVPEDTSSKPSRSRTYHVTPRNRWLRPLVFFLYFILVLLSFLQFACVDYEIKHVLKKRGHALFDRREGGETRSWLELYVEFITLGALVVFQILMWMTWLVVVMVHNDCAFEVFYAMFFGKEDVESDRVGGDDSRAPEIMD